MSTHEQPNKLFIVIGFQLDINMNENVAVVMDSKRKPLFISKDKLSIEKSKNIYDIFNNATTDDLFCYRCLKTVFPNYKISSSEFYTDIDSFPILAAFPHCPECENEVYSKTYHSLTEEFKSLLKKKHRINEV